MVMIPAAERSAEGVRPNTRTQGEIGLVQSGVGWEVRLGGEGEVGKCRQIMRC